MRHEGDHTLLVSVQTLLQQGQCAVRYLCTLTSYFIVLRVYVCFCDAPGV